MKATDGKGEAELRVVIGELEREVRIRTGELYSEALRSGDWRGASAKVRSMRVQVEQIANLGIDPSAGEVK